MSFVIQWATPDQYENIDLDVLFVKIERSALSPDGPFLEIAQINATTDGLAKMATNDWIDIYEDLDGSTDNFYRVAFVDANGKVSAFTDPMQGGFLSAKHVFMDQVRIGLGDSDPLFYQLDCPQLKWNGTQFSSFLDRAISTFNMRVTPTTFTFENFPQDGSGVLISGGIALAHMERASKEIANVQNWSDGGASIQITNRANDYRTLGQKELDDFKEDVDTWKLSHRVRAKALGVERVPFRIARPLSMIPNFSRIFRFGA